MSDPAVLQTDHEGSLELVSDVPVTVVIRDLGGTTAAEVWLGSRLVTGFMTHTRYPANALDIATETLANALAPLIAAAAVADGLEPWDPTVERD